MPPRWGFRRLWGDYLLYTYRTSGALGGNLGYYTAFRLKTEPKGTPKRHQCPHKCRCNDTIANFDTTFAEICVILL